MQLLLVAGQNALAVTADRRMVQARLGDALGGDRDGLAAGDVGDVTLLDGLVDHLLDLGARPLHEALAVPQALLLGVEPAVYEVGSAHFGSVQPALLTRMYHSTRRRTCRSV